MSRYPGEYRDLIGRVYTAVPDSLFYQQGSNGRFAYLGDDPAAFKEVVKEGIPLKVVGVLRAGNNATVLNRGGLGYTQALIDLIIKKTDQSPAVRAQLESPERNVLNGLLFHPENDAIKAEETRNYLEGLVPSQKALMSERLLKLFPSQTGPESSPAPDMPPGGMNREQLMSLIESFQGSGRLPGGLSQAIDPSMMEQMMDMAQAYMQGNLSGLDETQKATMLDLFVKDASESQLVTFYDEVIAREAGSLEDTLRSLGMVDKSSPSSISLYSDSFEAKEALTDAINRYNGTADADKQITYTDFVSLITSSVTNIVNVITFVLVAFVAVSLVVSSLMIGIITYISVLERTKEIGILRAVGASKRTCPVCSPRKRSSLA